VRARDARGRASGPPPVYCVVMPDDVVGLFASSMDGKTARKCARVCQVFAERARTHEDLRAPVAKSVSEVDGEDADAYMQKYVVKGAAIHLSTSELERKMLHKELFGDSDSEDDE
jgi:hypothetical protein